MNESPQSSELHQFMVRLTATARARATLENLPLKVELRPAFAAQAFKGVATTATTLSASDLPADCIGLTVGRYALVLGLLPDFPTQEAVLETTRRYRNQCVIARSCLSPSESLDLQLMLLGPRGSDIDGDWDTLARLVERDDRAARKLVWLMPEMPERDDESYERFIKQTFLARPWRQPTSFKKVQLDTLGDAEVKGDGLPPSTVVAWEEIALNEEMTPDEIVEALIKAWDARTTV
jgi:hypothetical protein